MRVRLFVDEPIQAEKTLALPQAQAHYLARVLRLAPGATIAIFNGTGGEWDAKIVSLSATRAVIKPLVFHADARETQIRIVLMQALVKGEKPDWIVQKATEAGASSIVFFPAERSVVRVDARRFGKKLARLCRIAIEAAEQSGRTRVPEIRYAEALDDLPDVEAGFVLDPGGQPPLAWQSIWQNAACIGLAVGPEGGFTDDEIASLKARGLRQLRLGARVLRTETAGLVAIAALLALHPCGIHAENGRAP